MRIHNQLVLHSTSAATAPKEPVGHDKGGFVRAAPRFGAWNMTGFAMRAVVLTARQVGPYNAGSSKPGGPVTSFAMGTMAYVTPRAFVVVSFAIVVRPGGYYSFCMTAVAFQLGHAQTPPRPAAPPAKPTVTAKAPDKSLTQEIGVVEGVGKQTVVGQPLEQAPQVFMDAPSPSASLLDLNVDIPLAGVSGEKASQ